MTRRDAANAQYDSTTVVPALVREWLEQGRVFEAADELGVELGDERVKLTQVHAALMPQDLTTAQLALLQATSAYAALLRQHYGVDEGLRITQAWTEDILSEESQGDDDD